MFEVKLFGKLSQRWRYVMDIASATRIISNVLSIQVSGAHLGYKYNSFSHIYI